MARVAVLETEGVSGYTPGCGNFIAAKRGKRTNSSARRGSFESASEMRSGVNCSKGSNASRSMATYFFQAGSGEPAQAGGDGGALATAGFVNAQVFASPRIRQRTHLLVALRARVSENH